MHAGDTDSVDTSVLAEKVKTKVDSGISVKDAVQAVCRKHGGKYSTLERQYYRLFGKGERHRNCALTTEENDQLVIATLVLSNVNMDLTCKQLLTLVECLFTKKLSIAWAFNWKSSHQHLFSFKSVTSLCPMRQKTDIVEKTQAFIDKLGNFLEIVSIPSYAIINYDEVRISATRDKFEVHRLIDRRKLKPQHASYISGADIGTYIPFVAADGHVFYSFFILKHKFGSNPSDDVTLSLRMSKNIHIVLSSP